MRVFAWFASVMLCGCTCGKRTDDAASSPPPLPSAQQADAPPYELHLHRNALVAFGNSTPLPVSEEFSEGVPAIDPPLQRAAAQRPGQPLRVRVERDVPYGQLTRMMQAALPARVVSWELVSADATGKLRSIPILPPGATPRGSCWVRAWIAPEGRVHVGLDTEIDAGAPMKGVIVDAAHGAPQGAKVVDVLRRLDFKCKEGQVRLYTQPTARFGPLFDVALAVLDGKPNVAQLMAAVPSIGPLDSPSEVVK